MKIQIKDENHWHELRSQRIGASEAGALIGQHNYLDLFKIYHQKLGTLDNTAGDHAWWGQQDEAIIAKYLIEKKGMRLEKVNDYYIHDTYRLGATPDYIDLDTGKFVQIKSTIKMYKSDDLPMEYETQVQVEMFCTGTTSCILAVKYANRDVQLYERDANPEFQNHIGELANQFWAAIERQDEPTVTALSSEAAKRIYAFSDDLERADMSDDKQLNEWVTEFAQLRPDITEMMSRKDFLDAAIKQRIGTAAIVLLDGYELSAKTDKRGTRVLRIKGDK
jgi:putative phage-type endonuclease